MLLVLYYKVYPAFKATQIIKIPGTVNFLSLHLNLAFNIDFIVCQRTCSDWVAINAFVKGDQCIYYEKRTCNISMLEQFNLEESRENEIGRHFAFLFFFFSVPISSTSLIKASIYLEILIFCLIYKIWC